MYRKQCKCEYNSEDYNRMEEIQETVILIDTGFSLDPRIMYVWLVLGMYWYMVLKPVQ